MMIIAHDLGTTGDKATLVDGQGRMVAAVTDRYPTDFGPGGKAEQNPRDWWDSVCQASRALVASGPGVADQIEAVCFSGQMMGAVLLDQGGEPVRPAIIWADTRSGQQTGRVLAAVDMERAYAITGHRLNPTYSLSKIMWVRDTEPDLFASVRHFLLAKDYIAFRLTGVMATDPSDASSTNAYDQSAAAWSEEIIDAAGLPASLFPPIVASTAVVGGLTAEAAVATGLKQGTPVVMGGGDGPMAALGAGIIGPDSGAYCYLGSSSWVSLAAEAPLHDPGMCTMTFNHVIPGRFVPTATMQTGGAAIEWITDVLGPGEPDRYARLLGRLSEVQASADGLYFLPHLLGERSPYWNPRARAVFAGLGRHHRPDNLVRAVVEGVAFNLLTGLRAFTGNGLRIDRVDAIGGAANSAAVLQILADIWGVRVTPRDLVDEATSLGAAVVAGVGIGLFDGFDIASRLSARGDELTPAAAETARAARSYDIFMDAYRRLEPWFESL
jgi:xylulokinase